MNSKHFSWNKTQLGFQSGIFMRVKMLNSTYYEKSSEFESAIVSFLSGIKLYKEELRSLLTLNFRTVGGTSVQLSQTSS